MWAWFLLGAGVFALLGGLASAQPAGAGRRAPYPSIRTRWSDFYRDGVTPEWHVDRNLRESAEKIAEPLITYAQQRRMPPPAWFPAAGTSLVGTPLEPWAAPYLPQLREGNAIVAMLPEQYVMAIATGAAADPADFTLQTTKDLVTAGLVFDEAIFFPLRAPNYIIFTRAINGPPRRAVRLVF